MFQLGLKTINELARSGDIHCMWILEYEPLALQAVKGNIISYQGVLHLLNPVKLGEHSKFFVMEEFVDDHGESRVRELLDLAAVRKVLSQGNTFQSGEVLVLNPPGYIRRMSADFKRP